MPELPPDHPAFHSIAERVRRWSQTEATRYLAIERCCRGGYVSENEPGWDWRTSSQEWRWRPQPSDSYQLVGGLHPTLFKTLRNASRAVANRVGSRNDKVDSARSKPPGVIFPLLLSLLPAIDSTEVFEGADLDELQYAERQMQLWADRTVEIRSKRALASGKPDYKQRGA